MEKEGFETREPGRFKSKTSGNRRISELDVSEPEFETQFRNVSV